MIPFLNAFRCRVCWFCGSLWDIYFALSYNKNISRCFPVPLLLSLPLCLPTKAIRYHLPRHSTISGNTTKRKYNEAKQLLRESVHLQEKVLGAEGWGYAMEQLFWLAEAQWGWIATKVAGSTARESASHRAQGYGCEQLSFLQKVQQALVPSVLPSTTSKMSLSHLNDFLLKMTEKWA